MKSCARCTQPRAPGSLLCAGHNAMGATLTDSEGREDGKQGPRTGKAKRGAVVRSGCSALTPRDGALVRCGKPAVKVTGASSPRCLAC